MTNFFTRDSHQSTMSWPSWVGLVPWIPPSNPRLRLSCTRFWDYLTLKIVTLNSRLRVTRTGNFCTIFELYRPEAICLPLIVRSIFIHFYMCREFRNSSALLAVIQGHWNRYQSKAHLWFPISLPLQSLYPLSLPLSIFNDLLVENRHFFVCTHHYIAFICLVPGLQ